VIAQELEQVYPQAVGKSVNFIPNVYTVAAGVEQLGGSVRFTLGKAHGLQAGDKVKWFDDKGAIQQSVVSRVVSDVAFEVKFDGQTSKAFVYGKEVNDFRTVDYDAVTMLNVSATQELAKRLEQLESRESHLAQLEQKAAKVDALEEEMAELKRTVAQLAQTVKAAKMASAPIQTETATPASFTVSRLEH